MAYAISLIAKKNLLYTHIGDFVYGDLDLDHLRFRMNVPCYAFRYIGVYHHMLDIRLKLDVAVCAVDDTAGLKTPIVVCHVLD